MSEDPMTALANTVLASYRTALALRLPHVAGHGQRVADLACAIAERTDQLTATALAALRRGLLLHDLGKLAIPAAILFKPTTLTAAEWAAMQLHPVYGYHWLLPLHATVDLAVVRSHHEHWLGHGYPDGLVGEAIPITVRITTIADVYDALRVAQAYKPAWSHADAYEKIAARAGIDFDPGLVELALAVITEREADVYPQIQ